MVSKEQRLKQRTLGNLESEVEIVEYGDYTCVESRNLQQILKNVKNEVKKPLSYVFRHFPPVHDIEGGFERAVAAEAASRQGKFWVIHQVLFEQGERGHFDIGKAAEEAGLDQKQFYLDKTDPNLIKSVQEDIAAARAQGINKVPTLFINGRRYYGPWDSESIREVIEPPMAARIGRIAQEFASWAAAAGLMLILFSLAAMAWRNSAWGDTYDALWQLPVLLGIGEWSLDLSLHHIVNDFFMALFFLVVGLELKREILSGELSEFKRGIIPIAAAAGGMIVPASIYLAFNIGTGGSVGWGVPMATDIAFTLGVLALLGSRVPTSMKVFAAALAVVDDLGAILVLAIGYNHGISWAALAAAGGLMAVLMGFNAARVYRLWPYLIVGALLWTAVYSSGLHATIAGVLVAVTIPERERPSIIPMLAGITSSAPQLMHHLQTSNVSEDAGWHYFARRIREIDLRLRSPASRLEHALQPWSQYFILPVFALANAGIELSINNVRPTDNVVIGIFLALVVGKPVGIFAGAWLIDQLGLGRKPDDATWPQVLGVGMLCGIGFTMSIFIANEAFGGTTELATAKLAIIAASLVAGLVGFIFLFGVSKSNEKTT